MSLETRHSQPPAVTVLPSEPPLWLAWDLAIDAFISSRRARSRHTASAYRSDLALFFTWADVEPWQVTPAIVTRYVHYLRRQGRAEATINRRLSALSSFYLFLRIYRSRDRHGRDVALWPPDRANPFEAIERPRVSPYGRARYPTTRELEALLAAIHPRSLTGKRDRALIYTLAITCLRASAVLELRWGDLEARPDGHYNLRYRCKGGDRRRAVLPATAYRYICDYLVAAGRPPQAMQPGEYVFIALDPYRICRLGRDPASIDPARPISRCFANRILKKYARRAGVEKNKCHLHGLRHAGARLRAELARAAGGAVDLLQLMHLLGHSSVAITQIYADRVLEDPEDPGLAEADRVLRSPFDSQGPT